MDADPSGQAGPAPLPTAEDLLWAFTFGAVLAPLYEVLMGGRLIGRPSDKEPFSGRDTNMTLSALGQVTLQALRCLKPSGEQSFEKLTATLLSLLIGVPIRLCKSGYQAGIDAL